MAGTLQTFYGFEYPSQLLSLGLIQRSTTTVDPLAGAQSARGPETFAATDYRLGLLSGIGPGGSFTRGGMGWWYNVASAPGVAISMASFNFLTGGGTAQNFNLCVRSDLKLEMYDAGTSTATQGSATGTVSSTAISAATGYWVWIDVDYPSATGTVTINVYVDFVLFYTYTFTATGGGTSTVSCNMFGISGASAASVNHFIDNAIAVRGIDGSEGGGHQWRCAAKRSLVTGDGTDSDFGVVNAGADTLRSEAVDETTPNDDTDYVFIDSTTAQEQTFTMSDPGAPGTSPTIYRPVAVESRIRYRNGDAGKWAASHQGRAYFQNTFVAGGAAVPDSAAYVSGVVSSSITAPGYYNFGLNSRLTAADIADMEMGVMLTANASEAAQWRVSALQAEVLYLPPLMRERVTMRGVGKGVMRGVR